MANCRGCGYPTENRYLGIAACSESCAKRAFRDKYRRAYRAWKKEVAK